MPNKCCVPGCRSNYDKSDPSITVFSFPKDLIRAEIWLQAIHRSDYQLSKFSRVCMKHFDERFIVCEDIATRPDGSVLVVKRDHLKLTDDAIPTIFDDLPSYLPKKLSPQRKPPAQRQLEHEKRIEKNKQHEESMDKISSYEELKNDLTVKSDLELENVRMNDMENIEDEPEGFTTIFIKEERIPPDDEFSEDVEVDVDIAVVEASDPFQLNEGCSSASRESDIEISAPSSCVEQGAKSEQCEELNSSDPLSKNIDVLSATGNCSVCSFCDERFHSKFDLKEHITIIHTGQHTEKKPYECDFCGKSFTFPSKLNYHMRTHTGEVCYKCEFCGKMFSLKSVHKNHVNVCSKQEIVLKNHITRMHTAIRSFKCHFCNKSFINMDTLLHHTRTHSGEKPHKCEYCNKCFSNQTHLSDHKTNTGKKPYKCEFCGKSFTYKSTLDRHIRTHSGEKPCNCLFCGKSFTRKSGLTAHMRTHGVKPSYKCEFCGQSFPNNSAFNEHITTHTL